METRAEVFAWARPMLFSIAYRMLGSVMDAEDLVQDAFLRWEEAAETDVVTTPLHSRCDLIQLKLESLPFLRYHRRSAKPRDAPGAGY